MWVELLIHAGPAICFRGGESGVERSGFYDSLFIPVSDFLSSEKWTALTASPVPLGQSQTKMGEKEGKREGERDGKRARARARDRWVCGGWYDLRVEERSRFSGPTYMFKKCLCRLVLYRLITMSLLLCKTVPHIWSHFILTAALQVNVVVPVF